MKTFKQFNEARTKSKYEFSKVDEGESVARHMNHGDHENPKAFAVRNKETGKHMGYVWNKREENHRMSGSISIGKEGYNGWHSGHLDHESGKFHQHSYSAQRGSREEAADNLKHHTRS